MWMILLGMPRQPRIEYEGALYHIMNRGHYRDYVFDVFDAGELFEQTLFGVCSGFRVRLEISLIDERVQLATF